MNMRWLRSTCAAAILSLARALPAGDVPARSDDPTAEIPDVAKPGEAGYVLGELIYALDDRPSPQCHASTLAESPSGLVVAWFGGTREKHDDVGIWVSRHEGGQWKKPQQVATGSEGEGRDYPCWNPVLFQPRNGPLLLFYKVGPSPSQWWGMLMTSADGGRNWSTPRRLGTDPKIGPLLGPVKNKPVELADGSMLCPSSTEHAGWRVHFERSADLGATWEVIGPVNDGKAYSAIQPTILVHDQRTLQALCRSQQGVIAQLWSRDGGKTWSDMTATDLPNPDAGVDGVTLKDGRHVLVYNHTTRRGNPSGREMLNVAVSRDGRHWKPVWTLERQKGEHSYPAIIQASDGMVHVTYTYLRQSVKHVVLDPKTLPAD